MLRFKIINFLKIIVVFTIFNSSSLQADEQGTLNEWLINVKNLALDEGISLETLNNSLIDIKLISCAYVQTLNEITTLGTRVFSSL